MHMNELEQIRILLSQPKIDESEINKKIQAFAEDLQTHVSEFAAVAKLIESRRVLFADAQNILAKYTVFQKQIWVNPQELAPHVDPEFSTTMPDRMIDSPLIKLDNLKKLAVIISRRLIFGMGANGWEPNHTQILTLIKEMLPSTYHLLNSGNKGGKIYQKYPSVLSTMIMKRVFIPPVLSTLQPEALTIEEGDSEVNKIDWQTDWANSGNEFLTKFRGWLTLENEKTDSKVSADFLTNLENVLSEYGEIGSPDFYRNAVDHGILHDVDIWWSIRFGLISVLETHRIESGQTVSIKEGENETTNTAIYLSFMYGDENSFFYFLDQVSKNIDVDQFRFLIGKAIGFHRPIALERLLELASDIDLRLEEEFPKLHFLPHWKGESILHLATFWGSVECVPILIKFHRSLLDATDRSERTPLHWATRGEWDGITPPTEIAIALLEHGANIDAEDIYGSTTLHLTATGLCNPDLASVLIRRGASLNARDKNGQTPLHVLAQNSGIEDPVSENPEYSSKAVQLAKVLIESGARVDIKDAAGRTALELVAVNENTQLRDYLLGIDERI